MLFYPDQYFYQNYQRPASKASDSSRRRRSQRPEQSEEMPWEEIFYTPNAGFSAQPWGQRRQQQYPNEYVVVDEDELAALRAYRESKRRAAEKREALLARKRAAEERKALEAARREAEMRMRAQVEANARAAAREYFRRKQAQQIALQRAQEEERRRRQQFVLEQLRNNFGLFTKQASPPPDTRPKEENAELAQETRDASNVEANLQQENNQEAKSAESQEEARNDNEQDSSEIFDPISSLIEALAPYPFALLNDSSEDEEEERKAKAEEPRSQRANKNSADYHEQEDDAEAEEEEEDEDEEGPVCETASEDSEPAFVEYLDPLAQPPISYSDDLSQDEGEDEGKSSRKDKIKERQSRVPKDRQKRQKHQESRRKSKSSAAEEEKNDTASESRKTTPAEVVGLMNALEDDLKRLNDGYNHLKSLPEPDNVREAVSRVEGIRIGARRSEEIYNKLDQVKVGKDQRKLKHQITTDSVALADKFDELLKAANEIKEKLCAASKASENPKHQVTLEEVADESD